MPGKPVIPENWHFTVRFLGATEPARRDRLIAQLAATSLGPAFTIRFGELGAFPNPRRARILWVGVAKGVERFRALEKIVEQIVTATGFEPEKRDYTPHLTVSRIDPPRSVTTLLSSGQSSHVGKSRSAPKLAGPSGEMRVDSLVLFRSLLGAGPPRYEEIVRFALGG